MEKTIGRREIISFPDLMVDKIKAKVDTGAYGTALHVDNISVINDELTFTINNNKFTYTKFKMINVKSSFGKKQKRFCLNLSLKLVTKKTTEKNLKIRKILNLFGTRPPPCVVGCPRVVITLRYIIGRWRGV